MPKRFWSSAQAAPVAGGHVIKLDGREARTPAKTPLIVPSAALADAVAREWDAQDKVLDPASMPLTRMANAALDKVAQQKPEIIAMLAAYADTDLLCYRADRPTALIQRQNATWDPYLEWSAQHLGARLRPTTGVMHIPQARGALDAIAQHIGRFGPFGLAALHDLISISGSAVLGLAVAYGFRTPEAVWMASRTDEDWQAEQWGADEEAARAASHKRVEFLGAVTFLDLLERIDV